MRAGWSALKHGISRTDVEHAWTNALRLVEYEYEEEERLLVIGQQLTPPCSSWLRFLPQSQPGSFMPTACDRSSTTI